MFSSGFPLSNIKSAYLPEEMLPSARPEIGKNEISGHQKNKIPVAATQQR